MKLDEYQLMEWQGIKFETEQDMINYIRSITEYLATHNNNYTDEQLHKILILNDIINCIK